MPGFIQNRRLLLPGSASITPNAYGATLWLKGDYATEQSERARDSSGQGNHGAIYSGRAMQFDGVADYTDLGVIAALADPVVSVAVRGLTCEASTPNNENIFGETTTGGAYGKLLFRFHNSTTLRVMWNNTVVLDADLTGIDITAPHSYVVARTGVDGDLNVSVKVDGVEVDSVSGVSTPLGSTTSKSSIGRAGEYAASGYGEITAAGVEVWAGEITDNDALWMHNNPEKLASDRPGTSLTTSDLAGWWPLIDGFNDADWDLVLDASGNGNHGTNVSAGAAHLTGLGAGWPQMVYRGWSRKHVFDGTDDFVGFTGGATESGTMSFAFSVIPVEFASSGGRWLQWGRVLIQISADKQILYWPDFAGPSVAFALAVADFDDQKAHHIVITQTGTTGKCYVDGILEDTESPAALNTVDSSSKWFGRYSSNYAEGLGDELSVWTVELDADEVAELYNYGTPLDATTHSQAANLVGYWRNTGRATWEDLSGNGNDGTVNGSPDAIYIPAAPGSSANDGLGFPLTNPRDVEAFNWDGASHGVIPDAASLRITTDYTIGFFAKVKTDQPNKALHIAKDKSSAREFVVGVSGTSDGGNDAYAEIYGNGGNEVQLSNGGLSDDTVHFIAISRAAGETDYDFYIDGEFNSSSDTKAEAIFDLQGEASDVWIGGREYSGANGYADLISGDFFIIPAALTPSQHLALYNALKGKYGL